MSYIVTFNDTFVFLAQAQTLTNKTLTTPWPESWVAEQMFLSLFQHLTGSASTQIEPELANQLSE